MALTTRRRRLVYTSAAGVLFLAGAATLARQASSHGGVYRPGETIEGLTADLARSLPADYPRVTFRNVTDEAGLRFRHFAGVRSSQIVEDMGSGVAWGDYDDDGWDDLLVVNESGPVDWSDAKVRASTARTALFHNNGDGTFRDATAGSGIDQRGLGMGAAWGDYDGDGRLDLLITGYGGNLLYHNDGGGRFSDRTLQAGLGAQHGFWTAAAWGDYDRDGDLDVYITGYVRFTLRPPTPGGGEIGIEQPTSINPSSFPPERNLLYRNDGAGRFTEVAVQAGVVDSLGRGLAATWVDLDQDGWLDLYVGNDVSDNVLYRNLGNGRFEDVSHLARVADYRSAMGIAVGDWDGDLDQDLFVTHWIAQENALYSNGLSQRGGGDSTSPPRLQFMDEADRFGLGQIALDYIGWGTSFFDYDNDGRLDLIVVNGSTFQRRSDPTKLVPMRDQLFWNRGPTEGFFDVSPVSGPYFREEFVGRGAAVADYDRDGDLDVAIVNHGGPLILLRNEGGNTRSWLQVALRGSRGNRYALGARLRLVAGNLTQFREIGVQASYLSQNSVVEHFGLGAAATADTLEVTWPDGRTEIHAGLPPNRRVTIIEGEPWILMDRARDSPEAERQRTLDFWEAYRAATTHRTAGRNAEAAAEYQRALALDPDHEDALYYLGNVRLALGQYRDAAEAWGALARVNQSSARAHLQLGAVHLCAEPGAPFDPVAAAAEFRVAHEINKEETGALLHLGEAALYLGDTAQARRHFTTVVGSHRDSPRALFHLGFLEWLANHPAGARTAYARAVAGARATPSEAGPSHAGDTQGGSVSLVTQGIRCDTLGTLSRGLADIPAADLDRVMEERYRAQALLLRLRRSR